MRALFFLHEWRRLHPGFMKIFEKERLFACPSGIAKATISLNIF
jgi:hypothetical protein